eukprot:3344956-Amphidinium_carterae.1
MQHFATLQEQLSTASIQVQEAQAAEAQALAVVQRIQREIAEHATPMPAQTPASQHAMMESFISHTPNLSQLDEPTQELLRLA